MTHEDYQMFQCVIKPLSLVCKGITRFLENFCVGWKSIPFVAAYIYFLFWHVLADVTLVVWKQLLQDYLLFLALPFYLVLFSGIMSDIYEYSKYEKYRNLESDIDALRKDVYLSVWEEAQYYKFLDKKGLDPCCFGSDETNVEELKKSFEMRKTKEKIEKIEKTSFILQKTKDICYA